MHFVQRLVPVADSKAPTLKPARCPVRTLDDNLVALEASRVEAELSRGHLPVVLAGLLLGHAFHWIAGPEHFVAVVAS